MSVDYQRLLAAARSLAILLGLDPDTEIAEAVERAEEILFQDGLHGVSDEIMF